MADATDVVSKVRAVTSDSLRGIVVYDEHVYDVLYRRDGDDLPVVDREGLELEKDLIRRHLTEEPFTDDADGIPYSYTYHTESVLAVQFPLVTYYGVFVVFDSNADPSLQELHEVVRDWQQERQATIEEHHNPFLGLLSVPLTVPQVSATALACCCCGLSQFLQTCCGVLPV